MDELHTTNASLSTMWAINNYPDLNAFFLTSRQLGFEKIELNHQVDSSILSTANLDHLQVSSIHEPCPADIPTKELVDRDWLISSPDEASRQRGVEAVKHSIRLAHRLRAPVVVIHCGIVSSVSPPEGKLRRLFETGHAHSDEYLEVKSGFVQTRNDLVAPHMEAVIRSLGELLDFADGKQVKLGLENRYHYMDIPAPDEMETLLCLADSSRLGFIYDVGHAQAMDRLGFYSHEDWLRRFSSRMLGAHLHDVIGVADHFSPGRGEIDFSFIAPYLPNDVFRTLELAPGNTLAQVKQAVPLLVQAGCIRYL